MVWARLFMFAGSVAAGLGVALGAFGAHALKTKLTPTMLSVYETGVHYQFVHALGLILVGLSASYLGDAAGARWAGWLMLAGIVLFSGSLYLLALTGMRWLGAITPLGGVCFIAAWTLFAIALWRAPA